MLVIIGATGFLGRHLLEACQTFGYSVKAITRGGGKRESFGSVEWATVDFFNPNALVSLIGEGDTVINLAFPQTQEENFLLLDSIVDACVRKKASRFIHCSTAMVVGRSEHSCITEQTPASPISPYELLKWQLEQKVLGVDCNKLHTIVLRPTSILGAGGSNLVTLARSLLYGRRLVNYLRASFFGDRQMHLVSVTTVAASILHLVELPAMSSNEVFIVSADDDADNRFLYVESMLMSSLGLNPRRAPLLKIPRVVLSVLLRLRGRSDTDPKRTYSARKLRSTGFVVDTSIADAVSNFGRWFRRHGR
jgi:nucleoside-diphosphate-sugar epimerase